MGDEIGQPEYRRVMVDLRRKISEGLLEVGQPIPSTSKLQEEYEVSSTVVRRAVSELRNEGLLYGHPGKAVYVRAKPDINESEQVSIERLAQGLDTVQSQLDEMQASDRESLSKLSAEVSELRRLVVKVQTQLIELYGRVGQPYPRESLPLQDDAGPKRSNQAGA